MQENNFEKQVQQKSGELELQPSDEVWQKVAAVIAKKKTDRRIFAIILLLLLFTGSAVFIRLDRTSTTKTIKAISAQTNSITTKQKIARQVESNPPRTSGEIIHSKIANKNHTDEITNSSKDITVKKNKVNLTGHTPVGFLSKKMAAGSIEEQGNNENNQEDVPRDVSKKNKVSHITKGKESISITNANASDLTSENIPRAAGNNNSIPKEALNNPAGSQQVGDPVSKEILTRKQIIPGTQMAIVKPKEKDSTLMKVVQSRQKNKWKVGFNFSLGASATQNSYLGVTNSGNSAADLYAANPGQASGNPGQLPYSANPSTIKMSIGFVAGMFVQKDISPRIHFIAGLNYKFYSSHMKIGNRIDSNSILTPANYYYRSGSTTNYKNNFHFLELPVSVLYKIGKQSRFPFYINAGISISRLISLHALQFDPSSGNYYKHDAPFNKTQLAVSTGLLFSLSGAAKNPLLIGPDINFSLSKMSDAGLYANRHYSYFGMLLQKTIGKK